MVIVAVEEFSGYKWKHSVLACSDVIDLLLRHGAETVGFRLDAASALAAPYDIRTPRRLLSISHRF